MKKILLSSLLISFTISKGYTQCFSKIDAGNDFNLGIKSDGSLWTWGANYNGQLGNGTNGFGNAFNVTIPTQIEPESNWQNISAGDSHSLAIKSDGSLWTWGDNGWGNLGLGTNSVQVINVPTQIGSSLDWQIISAGTYYSLAIKNDGSLWGWGRNTDGQLGNGIFNQNAPEPIQIGTDNNWQNVIAGEGLSLATKSDGTLWAWGRNANGSLGNGTTVDSNIPIQIGSNNDWGSIASGIGYCLAIKNDGTLWAWGSNVIGQFGNGSNVGSLVPIQIGSDTDWQSVDSGDFTNMAVKSNGTLWGWGNNGSGEVGNGQSGNTITIPTQITANNWSNVSVGDYHTIGLLSNDTMLTWGYNGNGQLGNGSTVNVVLPSIVDDCTSLYISEFDITNIDIYPNPTKSILTVSSKSNITKIEVYDLSGRLITSKNENSDTTSLNIDSFPNGMYFFKVLTTTGTSIKKVLKN